MRREKSFVAAILLLFWLAMVAGETNKSLGFDEGLHAIAGFSYWRFGDYGLQPENGNLPQRVAALPLIFGSDRFPSTASDEWHHSQAAILGYHWFYDLGNDAKQMAALGRAACGLLAVLLGAVVWAWSRRFFGPRGAMISLLLYVLSPTILANGALMTSDMAAALFLLAATWGWWAVLQRMSAGRVLGSALLAGCLFVSKASAVLIIPVMLALAAARCCDGRPLPVACGRWQGEVRSRARQALACAIAGIAHAAVVVAVIWAFYGFRFSAFGNPAAGDRFLAPWAHVLNQPDPHTVVRELGLSPEQSARANGIWQAHRVTEAAWSYDAIAALDEIQRTVLTPRQSGSLDAIRRRPPPNLPDAAIDFFRRHELLPEAWLYGFAYVLRNAEVRQSFWNGAVSERGWPGFFPYVFLVKTPLSVFGICALAAAAGWISWQTKAREHPGRAAQAVWRQLYDTLPLWTLSAVYWLAAVTSHLNVGHRHLLPVYAPLFILCGAAAFWLGRSTGCQPVSSPDTGWQPVLRLTLYSLLILLAAETAWRFPNYMAYFNGLVRPADAYRHVVDSSLDWGQELPAARNYIDRHPQDGPFYLSYFGMASPAYYRVPARLLYGFGGPFLSGNPDFLLTKLPPDRIDDEVSRLQRERTTYDLMGVGQIGDDIYAVFLKKASELRLVAGTYLISATMLQPVYYSGPRGPWNARYEAVYRRLQKEVQPLLDPDPAARAEAFKRYDVDALDPLLDQFEQYRLARLTAFLRQREPDTTLNDAILVYHLTDADLARALD